MPHDKLSHMEAIKLIWGIEKEFDVTNLLFQDIHIWPLLRIMIYNDNLLKSENIQKKTFLKKTLEKIKTIIGFISEGYINKKNISSNKEADVYILSYASSRTWKKNNLWCDFIFSPLVEWMKGMHKSVYFDEIAIAGIYKRIRKENSNYVSKDIAMAYLAGLFSNTKITKDLQTNISNISDYLISKRANSNSIQTKVLKQKLNIFIRLINMHEKKLVAVKPKHTFIVAYYSLQGMALMHACRKLSIYSIDVQHGIQSKYHVAYGTWQRVPAKGYSCLPSMFWTWNQTDANNIQISNKYHATISGGNIQHYYWHVNRPPKTNKNILVSLQPKGEILINEIINTIKSGKFIGYKWHFRLHPSMGEDWATLLDKKLSPYKTVASYVDSSILALPIVLSTIDLHVTLWSSVVIDAAFYNIPSLIYSEIGSEIFLDNVDRELLVFKEDKDSFPVALHRLIEHTKKLKDKKKVNQPDSKQILAKIFHET